MVDSLSVWNRPEPRAEHRWGPLHLRVYPPEHPTADIEIFVALVGAAALVGLWLLPLDLFASWLGECRFHALTGWPCVSCGVTRGVLALAHGQVPEALRLNPFFIGLLLLLICYAPVAWVLWLGRLGRPRLHLAGRGVRRATLAGLLLLLLANWAYLFWAGV